MTPVLDAFAFTAGSPGNMDRRAPEFNDLPDERCVVTAARADGIEGVMSFGFSRYKKCRPHLPEHVHPDCFEINFCQRGVLVFKSGETAYTVKPGHVFISKPDEPHHLTTNIKGLFLYWMLVRVQADGGVPILGLSSQESSALRGRLLAISSPCFPVQEDVRLLFQELFTAYRMPPKDAFRSVRLKSAALRILLSVIRDSGGRPHRIFQNAIVRAAQQIAEHPEKHYTLAELAQQADFSLSRFSALFKQATGLPPHKMIMLQRLKKAHKMLQETSTPITEIAYAMGFSSPRHFADEFKRTFGTSATVIRASAKSNAPVAQEVNAAPPVKPAQNKE